MEAAHQIDDVFCGAVRLKWYLGVHIGIMGLLIVLLVDKFPGKLPPSGKAQRLGKAHQCRLRGISLMCDPLRSKFTEGLFFCKINSPIVLLESPPLEMVSSSTLCAKVICFTPVHGIFVSFYVIRLHVSVPPVSSLRSVKKP